MYRRFALPFIGAVLLVTALTGFSGVALADGDSSVVFASAAAVNAKELDRQRGAGLDAAAVTFAATDEVAVILWDELKQRGGTGHVVMDSGTANSLTSTISGAAQ